MLAIRKVKSSLAEPLLVSQEGLCAVEFVTYTYAPVILLSLIVLLITRSLFLASFVKNILFPLCRLKHLCERSGFVDSPCWDLVNSAVRWYYLLRCC